MAGRLTSIHTACLWAGAAALAATVGVSAQGRRGAPPAQTPRPTPTPAQTSQQGTTVTPATPGQSTFRTRVTLVPLDIRVLDRATGQPITDLKQADFTVLEDNVRQAVTHFSTQVYTAATPDPKSKAVLRTTAAPELKQTNQRVFLLLLGRGRLQPPAKGVDAAIEFVKDMVFPQDLVAVLAFNRATDFTTDHDQILKVLEQFKKKHEDIESKLVSLMGGLAGVYGSYEVPEKLQKDIDAVFETPGAKPRQPAPSQISNAKRIDADNRAQSDALVGAGGSPTVGARAESNMDMSFDEFVDANSMSMQDLGKLYTGIDYLKYIDGEKHLVFITENGMALPRMEDDNSLAAAANNARVVIDTIQTGGVIAGPQGRGGRGGAMPDPIADAARGGQQGRVTEVGPATARGGRAGGGSGTEPRVVSNAPNGTGAAREASRDPFATPGAMFNQGFRMQSLRQIANLTGGQSSAYDYAKNAMAKINLSTSFSYQLGYYPTNGANDGRYRKVLVRVNRPNTVVLYRHGYDATEAAEPFDRKDYLTYNRIVSAAGYTKDIPDLKLTLTAAVDGEGKLVANITLDPSTVAFADANGLKTGAVTIAVFVGDQQQNPLGDSWQNIDMKLGAEAYARLVAEGVKHTVRIDMTRPTPMYVKVVAYDFAADKVGSALFKLAPR